MVADLGSFRRGARRGEAARRRGGDDEIVPPRIVESYLARMADRSNSRMVLLPDFDHDCCWVEAWPALLAR